MEGTQPSAAGGDGAPTANLHRLVGRTVGVEKTDTFSFEAQVNEKAGIRA